MTARILLLVLVAALVACQFTNGQCPNRGDLNPCKKVVKDAELFHRVAGRGPGCNIVRINHHIVVVTNAYGNNSDCSSSFWTKKPNYMEIHPIVADKGIDYRALRIKTILASNIRYTERDEFNKKFAPVTQNTIYYDASKDSDDSGFAFVLIARGSNCNYECKLDEGSSGDITLQRYNTNTFCQTWFTVNKNCQLKLDFESLEIGNRDEYGDCVSEYMAVNPRGEPGYSRRNSVALCGRHSNFSITSEAHKLNYVIYDEENGKPEIKGRYEVLC